MQLDLPDPILCQHFAQSLLDPPRSGECPTGLIEACRGFFADGRSVDSSGGYGKYGSELGENGLIPTFATVVDLKPEEPHDSIT
jgi:hypothetical protein